MKKSLKELRTLFSREIAQYIEDITQTEICKDNVYCKQLMIIFLKAK